jgi:hypothetical protein
MQVLNQLSGVISKTNKAWKVFVNELDGDIGYFSDILAVGNSAQSRAHLSFCATKVAFEDLETLEDKLDLLDKSCSTLAKTVSWSTLSYFVICSVSERSPANRCSLNFV